MFFPHFVRDARSREFYQFSKQRVRRHDRRESAWDEACHRGVLVTVELACASRSRLRCGTPDMVFWNFGPGVYWRGGPGNPIDNMQRSMRPRTRQFGAIRGRAGNLCLRRTRGGAAEHFELRANHTVAIEPISGRGIWRSFCDPNVAELPKNSQKGLAISLQKERYYRKFRAP